MRLHGRREIKRYLGRSPQNKNGWRKVREHSADVIRCYSSSDHLFALSEDLDALDRAHCTTLRELLATRGTKEKASREPCEDIPPGRATSEAGNETQSRVSGSARLKMARFAPGNRW